MTPNTRRRLALTASLLVAAVVFLTGIDWGLPSRAADPYLFGDRTPWDGQTILRLSGGWAADPQRGADVDADPLWRGDGVLVLNETDEQRAAIVLRYRLYSHQPDEMITFRALSRMSPGEFKLDPGLYQYGGLWIYPVGALLKIGSLLGLVDVTPDVAHYLEHPDAFARFYVVARLYSTAWGLVGVWAVFQIVSRMRRDRADWFAPATAAVCFAMLPVVVTMSHEAKPHLPGAALTLLAVLAADTYARTGRRRWAWAAGALCGAAFGMVLTGVVAFVILPTMALLSRQTWGRRALVTTVAGLVGCAVFAATNPYVLINLVRQPELLWSNLGNTRGFYQATGSFEGPANAARLLVEAASPVVAVVGVIALLAFLLRGLSRHKGVTAGVGQSNSIGWLLLAPSVLTCAYLAAFAAGKPGEFGRLALLPAATLAVAAVAGVARWCRPWPLQSAALAVLLGFVGFAGAGYWLNFWAPDDESSPRMAYAEELRDLSDRVGPLVVGTPAEPAPYCMPPVDLFEWELLLLRKHPHRDRPAGGVGDLNELAASPVRPDVVVEVVDFPPAPEAPVEAGYVDHYSSRSVWSWGNPTPISWAAKPLRVRVRADLFNGAGDEGVTPADSNGPQAGRR